MKKAESQDNILAFRFFSVYLIIKIELFKSRMSIKTQSFFTSKTKKASSPQTLLKQFNHIIGHT